MARIPTNRDSCNPTNAVLRMHGIEPTLDAWLDFNGVSDVFDAELLEVIPAEFCDEYESRLRLNVHYERKFAEELAMKRAGVSGPDRSLRKDEAEV